MSARSAKAERKQEPVLPFRQVHPSEIEQAWKGLGYRPLAAWKSPQFLAAIYNDKSGFNRLTVNRTCLKPGGSGRWEDGITWDELQQIKRLIGFGDVWAVEIYPADDELVDVANMRHLWLFPEAPPFAWTKNPAH